MKIRTGFVSNSSTSSFCIMGVSVSEDELDELILKNFSDYIKSDEEDDVFIKNGDKQSCYYRNDIIFVEAGLSVEGNDEYWETGTSIGVRIEDMKNDETKAQFSERVSDLLNNVGIETKPDFIYDGCYEG